MPTDSIETNLYQIDPLTSNSLLGVPDLHTGDFGGSSLPESSQNNQSIGTIADGNEYLNYLNSDAGNTNSNFNKLIDKDGVDPLTGMSDVGLTSELEGDPLIGNDTNALAETAEKLDETAASVTDTKEHQTAVVGNTDTKENQTAVVGDREPIGDSKATNELIQSNTHKEADKVDKAGSSTEQTKTDILAKPNITFDSGAFAVDASGEVSIDYLLDGGRYQGELATFSIKGMDKFVSSYEEFIQEAARRALSGSELGYVVISDAAEGARFSGELGEYNFNAGQYNGVRTFAMNPGDEFGLMLVPNGTVQEVFNNPIIDGNKRPLFSLATANPLEAFHVGQIADVTGDGNTFAMEDLRADRSTDRDYNDIVFQVRGATGKAALMDDLVAPGKDWRKSDLGQALIAYTKPYTTPENPGVGEEIPEELLESIEGFADSSESEGEGLPATAEEVVEKQVDVEEANTNFAEVVPVSKSEQTAIVEPSNSSNNVVTAPLLENEVGMGEAMPEIADLASNQAGTSASDGSEETAIAPTSQDNNSTSTTQPTVGETVAIESEEAIAIAPTSQDNNSTSTTQLTVGETVAIESEEAIATSTQHTNSASTTPTTVGETAGIESEEVEAIAPSNQDNSSTSTTQPTVVETVASESVDAIASTTQATVTEPIIAPKTVVEEWLKQVNQQLTELENSGDRELQNLQSEISNADNLLYNQVYDLWSNLSGNGDNINALVDNLGDRVSSSGDYMNAWSNYLQSEISSIDSSTYNQSWDIWQNLSSNTDYINAWDNYLSNELSGTGQYMYDWAAYTANEINRVSDWMYGWTNRNWNENVRIENWMIDRTNEVVDEFNYYGVGDAAWNEYDALRNYRNSIVTTAENDYYDNASDRNTTLNNASSSFRAWDDYRVEVMDAAWNEYNSFDSYTDTVISDTWNNYRNVDNYRVEVMNDAWSDRNSFNNYQASAIDDAWSEYSALDNYTDEIMADAWNQYQAQDSTRYQITGDVWNQYSTISNSWNDSVEDTQAQIDVWAKIAIFEGRPYDAPDETKSGLPLIGIIDTGFSADNPDIDYSRITLGKDLVGGDDNPLLESWESWRDEHGTKMLEIIAATRNNDIGIDGINDKSPLWLGSAVGSGDWAQSLIEFVDAAKDSEQPNAVINLSFDLTETNPDGIVTTRQELTALETAALTYAQQNNVLVVAATGNQNSLMSALSKANEEFDNILVVGAAVGWQRADYSSYGEIDYANYGKGVDLLAQGTASNGAVGSSVAAAKVTGAASLVWAANPNLNYTQVMDILRRTATDLNAPGWDAQTGLGLLNIAASVHLAKATEPETYKSANLDLVRDVLKIYGIPEVYWKDFYNLSYYYDLEAKLTGETWSRIDSSIATERAAWDWSGAVVGAVVGAVLGDPVTGGVVGGLLGNSGGGGSSGGGSSNPFPQWAKNLANSTKQSLDSAVTVLDRVTQETSQAMQNADIYLQQLTSEFASEARNAANHVREQFDDGWNAAGSAANSAINAVNNGWNDFTNAADYARNRLNAGWNAAIDTADSLSGFVRDAWNETSDAVNSVQNRVNDGWTAIAKVANEVGDSISKSLDDLKKQGQDFKDLLDKNNPVGKLADDLATKLKSTLDGIDVDAVLNTLKRLPVLGTAVSGLEGLYYLAQGDWKEVLKSTIDGALAFYGASNVVTPKFVSLFIDVAWELKDKDYKGALAAALSNFNVERQLADTFVKAAWAMKDGQWEDVLSAGLSSAGFNNANKFVDMAWDVIDGDYQDALTTGLQVAGLDKLGIDQAKANAFVESAIALLDNQTSTVADQLLKVAGTNAQQLANSAWVQALKDTNPNNDRAALSQGLSAVGFQNVEQWVDMAWDVKEKKYLDALSTGFSLGGFTQGKDWVDMARDLQQNNYLDALSTGFKVAGFKKGKNLAKAAMALREGNLINAFYEGLSLVDGVGELVDAFKYLKDGNAKQGVPMMIQAAPKLAILIGT